MIVVGFHWALTQYQWRFSKLDDVSNGAAVILQKTVSLAIYDVVPEVATTPVSDRSQH